MPTAMEGSITHYKALSVAEISAQGTDALHECIVQEFTERGYLEDPELRWTFDVSMLMHKDQPPRSDGPFVNHVLRATLYGERVLGPHSPEVGRELAKTLLLHDLFEDRSDKVISALGQGLPLVGETSRQRALDVFRQRNFLTHADTLEALGRLTCPSFEGLSGLEKAQRYGRYIVDHVLTHPLAAIAKIADQIDNSLELVPTPNVSKRRRLDLKYFPLNHALQKTVSAPSSLIPHETRSEVVAMFQEGHEAARRRLQTATPAHGLVALTNEEVEQLERLLD